MSLKNISELELDIQPLLADDTERGSKFWNKTLVEMKFRIEEVWIRLVRKIPKTRKPNYGMQHLDPALEEITGNKLELVGPMLDSYLHKIGKSMASKLTHSKATGLVSLIPLFMPYSLFKHVWVLVSGYGGDMKTEKEKITLRIEKQSIASAIWSAARFSGENLLAKWHFEKVPCDGRKMYAYKGKSQVVVTINTPITFVYNIKQVCALISFYIQRYDKEDFVTDSRDGFLMITSQLFFFII